MNRIRLIIRREYLTKVNKKSFIILTILTPILFAALIFVPLWLTSIKSNEQKVFAVIDDTGLYSTVFQDTEKYKFIYTQNEDNKSIQPGQKEIYAFIVLSGNLFNNPDAVTIYSEKTIGIEEKSIIQNQLEKYLENEKLVSFNIPNIKEIIKESHIKIKINTIKIGENGIEKNSSSEMATGIALVGALLIYMFIFMYGSQVMNSILEEKTNRIVEVIISSVKPFQLMIGKIIGTALVGLTQFFLWILFTGIIVAIFNLVFGINSLSSIDIHQQINNTQTNNPLMNADVNSMISVFHGIDWITLVIYFIIYFLGGYLLYSSFFAAIGSAVDSNSDSQQFMLPVTIPLLFALYVAIYGVQNPEGPLVFWCSIIPFTSPIVMMMRLPFEVPAWEIALSIFLLVTSFIVSTWFSSKIYRTGILMYGKKVNYKEIYKWIKY